jgi:hypothetical protein
MGESEMERLDRLSANADATDPRRLFRDNCVWVALGLLLLCIAIYTLLVTTYLRPRNGIANLDFWYHIELGQRLNWREPTTLSDGLYPLGYPYLLRIAVEKGVDALRFGQFLSWLGGLFCLVACFGLIYDITHRASVAVAGVLLLIFNLNFLTHAVFEGNDLLAAGLQVLALWLLWLTASNKAQSHDLLFAFVGGIVLGLAYLMRYTSLILFPCAVLYLLWRGRRPRKVAAVGLLAAGFVLTTLVQLVPSALAYHQPFHNLQAKNVWFGIYGQGDYVRNWGTVPDTISLTEVIKLNPRLFLRHWWDQFAQIIVPLRLWPPVLHVTWLLGVVAILVDKRMHPANRLLIVLALYLPIALTAMAWLTPRFLLVSLVLEALVIALLIDRATTIVPGRARLPVILALVIILSLAGRPALTRWLQTPIDDRARLVNTFLRDIGMQDPGQVATNDPYLHATDLPERMRYDQSYFAVARPHSVAELLSHPAAADWGYLVLDFDRGFGDYSVFRPADPEVMARTVPLRLDESSAIYCIQPCFGGVVPDRVAFDNGMRLQGHSLQKSDRGLALILYWETDKMIDQTYKVSVRLLDGAGKLISQVDNVPQLWTRPTTTWKTGEVVSDFYYLPFDSHPPSDYRIALLVYQDPSQLPVSGHDEMRGQSGLLIDLPTVAQ